MQKRKWVSIIIILIFISIHFSTSKHCNAQIKQYNSYFEFQQLVQKKQNAKAIEIGNGLFNSIVSKYSGDDCLHDLQRRLKVAHKFVELIKKDLESRQNKLLENIVNLDIPPELPPIGKDEEERDYFLLPPEQIYWTYYESFSRKLNIQKVSTEESKFLLGYYDLRMQYWIKEIVNIVTKLAITNSEYLNLSYYSFILPLLYLCDKEPCNYEPDSIFALIGSGNLDLMSDFCLLRVDRPKVAFAIARYKAESQGKNFPMVDWTLTAKTTCIENHRPDLAERLLTVTIEALDDKEKIVELRLKAAEGYDKCGDHVTATKKCRQIAKDYPDSPLYGKVMYSYFAYLAKQSQTRQILAEIDASLQSRQCKRYLPQLMFFKWWALRKTNQQSLAKKIGEQLIEDHESSPYIAPILLTLGIDALSNQQYEKCRKLLVQLTRNFPQTNSAKRAQEILVHLDNK